MNSAFQERMQIPTRIHDVGCNFRGSNRLPEVTDPRSRTGDLVHPLCFADEDTKAGREWGAADKGREGKGSVEAFLLNHSLTLPTKEPQRKTNSAEGILVAYLSKALFNNASHQIPFSHKYLNPQFEEQTRPEPLHLNMLPPQAVSLFLNLEVWFLCCVLQPDH